MSIGITYTYVRWYLDGEPLRRNIRKRLARKWIKQGRLVYKETYPIEIPEADPSIPTGELITVVAVHGNTVTIKRGEQ
jgi:hypothetical protein